MRRVLKIAGLAILCAFAIVRVSHAATIDPESITVDVSAGKSMEQIVRLANDSDAELTYTFSLAEVTFGGDAEDLQLAELQGEHREWVTLGADALTIEPGATEEVMVTVNAPTDAAASDTFTFAVLATQTAEAGSGVTIREGLASLFFVNVDGGLQSRLSIEAFESVPSNDRALPVRFAALIKNSAAGTETPYITLEIRNIFGKSVENIVVNDLGRRVPGYTQRVFSAEWEGKMWCIGPHTATLTVVSDDLETPLVATTNVVLFPWQMLVILGGSLCIFAAAGYLSFRARRR